MRAMAVRLAVPLHGLAGPWERPAIPLPVAEAGGMRALMLPDTSRVIASPNPNLSLSRLYGVRRAYDKGLQG